MKDKGIVGKEAMTGLTGSRLHISGRVTSHLTPTREIRHFTKNH